MRKLFTLFSVTTLILMFALNASTSAQQEQKNTDSTAKVAVEQDDNQDSAKKECKYAGDKAACAKAKAECKGKDGKKECTAEQKKECKAKKSGEANGKACCKDKAACKDKTDAEKAACKAKCEAKKAACKDKDGEKDSEATKK